MCLILGHSIALFPGCCWGQDVKIHALCAPGVSYERHLTSLQRTHCGVWAARRSEPCEQPPSRMFVPPGSLCVPPTKWPQHLGAHIGQPQGVGVLQGNSSSVWKESFHCSHCIHSCKLSDKEKSINGNRIFSNSMALRPLARHSLEGQLWRLLGSSPPPCGSFLCLSHQTKLNSSASKQWIKQNNRNSHLFIAFLFVASHSRLGENPENSKPVFPG